VTKRTARPGHVGRGREPDPPEQLAHRYAALGPGGAEALAALWARPRLHAVAWQVLDAIAHARATLASDKFARGRREYKRDNAARDRQRKAPALAGYAPHPRLPGVLVRVRPEGERPLSFRLGRGQRIEADVLADLRAQLAALGAPSRGRGNVLAALVALGRPPRRP
jgi:hypothetical protein